MPIITEQELIDAAADALTLEKVVNDPANEPNPGQADGTVTARLGATHNNLAKILTLLESGTVTDGAITTAKLADNSVTLPKLGTDVNSYFNIGNEVGNAGKILRVNTAETGLEYHKRNLYAYGATDTYEGTQGYLNHGLSNNFALATNNSLLVVRGTDANPDSGTLYARTALFVELHTNAVLSEAQSVWGNPYKLGAVQGEAIAHAGFEGELSGANFRAYSANEPGDLLDTAKGILVGMACIGQTNTGTGNASHNVWGANIIAAQTSGNAPQNIVGIEVDVLNASSSVGLRPGTVGATNYTGVWVQSDAASGALSDAAFLITHTATSSGWNYGLVGEINCNSWLIWLKNNVNAPTAQGIRVETAWGAGANAVMELVNNGVTQMRVTGDPNNPVELRVGSGTGNFRAVKVGAPDTAGAGFRSLIVDN